MRIKICDENRNDIDAALRLVNGTANAWTITSYASVALFAREMEERLVKAGIPKAERKGAKARYIPAGPTAGAYKYDAASTSIRIERGGKDWFLDHVARVAVYPGDACQERLYLTDEQRETAIAKALRGIEHGI